MRRPRGAVRHVDGGFAINGASVLDNAFSSNGAPGTAAPTAFGFRVPDIIINARIDQAWGYVGVSGAIHDVSGAYYRPEGLDVLKAIRHSNQSDRSLEGFEQAEKILADGETDCVAAARQTLADPDWFRKIRLGHGALPVATLR